MTYFDCVECGARLDYRYCTFGESDTEIGEIFECAYAAALCPQCGTFHECVDAPADPLPARVMLWGWRASSWSARSPSTSPAFWDCLAASFESDYSPWPGLFAS